MQLNNTNINQLLSQAGLTANEAEVYLFLLKRGQVSGSQIYLELGMDKSSSYRSLKSLIEKNLVFKIGEERNQKFGVNSISNVDYIFSKRLDELDSARKSFSKVIKSLDSLTTCEYFKNNVSIFHGKDGYLQWNQSRLGQSVKLIRDISNRKMLEPLFESAAAYDEYMNGYVKKRVTSKIPIQILLNPLTSGFKGKLSNKELKETRILPKNFQQNAIISTWGENTGFISLKKGEVLSIIIRDELITSMINQMFDVIWSISAKV